MKKILLYILLILMIIAIPVYPKGENDSEKVPVVAMCRPTTDQIQNIVTMKAKGLFGKREIKLLCVYHERESVNYDKSKEYVKNSFLNWISFVEIKGSVARENLFRKNLWTSQFREIFESSDGIIFTGGMDFPTGIYNEKNLLLTEATTPYRSEYEVSFLFHLIGGRSDTESIPLLEGKKDYPVLGICLGAQTMNIAAGGTLIQDIPSEVYGLKTVDDVLKMDREKIHSSRYMKLLFPQNYNDIAPAFHRIKPVKGSVLIKKILNRAEGFPFVLSSHHQSVKKTGQGLFVAASSMDGKIVEALEHRKYKNVLGVQFHPEYRFLHSGMRFFTENPADKLYFTLSRFLKGNPPSENFHKNLWSWFTKALLGEG